MFLFFCQLGMFAQQDYDQDNLTPQFHANRRAALRQLLPDSSCAVFFAGPERQRANDTKYLYHQDPDFYYLTGSTEPNSMLLIFKEPQTFFDTVSCNEILFVHAKDPAQEMWTGKLMGVEGARSRLGFAVVYESSLFADFPVDFSRFKEVLHRELPTDVRDYPTDKGDLFSLISHFKEKSPGILSKEESLLFGSWINSLREIKQAEELTLMRKAIDMSCLGHFELMKALEPGMKEYQAQAVLEYMFKKEGSEYVGYPSIVGGGENSCILHYETNRKQLDQQDLLVLDAGAEYHGYTADITRTLPVNGTFSPEQKIIYQIVLDAQLAGIKACLPGNEFRASHKAAVELIQKRLLEIGLISEPGDYLKYFFHGTSHYLGLDVHDAGNYGKLAPGNIITVEPGIYIPAGSNCDPKWWNIGIRIEDDVLITIGQPEVLSGKLPKTIAEIEAVMKEESVFNEIK